MTDQLINIIEAIKEELTDNSDVAWTRYETAKQLRDELDGYIEDLRSGNIKSIEKLYIHFLPTATFQEHSVSNRWPDKYLRLAEKFDSIYGAYKTHS